MSRKPPKQTKLKTDTRISCRDRALRLLASRNYTAQELNERLVREDYPAQEVESTIKWLTEIGYVNDRLTAELFIDHRNRFRPTGVHGLRFELEQKGVDPETINAVMNSPDQDYALAYQLAKSRLEKLQHLRVERQYQRIGSLLQRRGFNWDVTCKVLEALFNSLLDTDLEKV
ncbi:MAG TPA: regulatory protein RecX [Firmicutes bacterium]|nr:regulatory protein RecX [Bacillota bacterium]